MMHWTLEHSLKSVHLGTGCLVPNSVFRAAALIQLGGCSSLRWRFCELTSRRGRRFRGMWLSWLPEGAEISLAAAWVHVQRESITTSLVYEQWWALVRLGLNGTCRHRYCLGHIRASRYQTQVDTGRHRALSSVCRSGSPSARLAPWVPGPSRLYHCSICGTVLPNEPKPVLQHQMSHVRRRPFAGSVPEAAAPSETTARQG
jgi:hypothetical protein